MLPQPLHPAVVHFPMALAVLLPISALVALWAIRRGAAPLKAWAIPVAFAAALTASGWVAIQTGEMEEDRVEAVVGEEPIHEHEEAAELFLLLSGIVALVAAAGLLGGTPGNAARIVATVGTVAVLAAGVRVGHLGGELVYRHGAGAAYVTAPAVDAEPAPLRAGEREDH